MSDKTGIQWTDATWNPIRGCSRVSEGCRNCYAEKVAHRFSGEGQPYEGLVTDRGRWNGNVMWVEKHLADPLRWQKPRMVFTNSMSDMFHPSLSFERIAALFGVMAAATRHTFQVLTKRPERAKAFFEWLYTLPGCSCGEAITHPHACYEHAVNLGVDMPKGLAAEWPLPNVWLGVSAEDQTTADERIPLLLQCPAAVRFVSAEPLLGPIDFGEMLLVFEECAHCGWVGPMPVEDVCPYCDIAGHMCTPSLNGLGPALDWVIVGGESGPGARPCDVAWVGWIVEQCRQSRVPVFVKQLGADVRDRNDAGFLGEDGDAWDIDDVTRVEPNPNGFREEYQGAPVRVRLTDRKGGDPSEWPFDLRVREFPEAL